MPQSKNDAMVEEKLSGAEREEVKQEFKEEFKDAFAKLDISHDFPHTDVETHREVDDLVDDLVDVTSHFTRLQKSLSAEDVIRSEMFDLFSGTYALEINNWKLDTGLISNDLPVFHTSSVLHIDYPQYTGLQHVTHVLLQLLKNVVTWIDNNNSSLTITVLSCKYVQEILQHYTNTLEILPSFETKDPLYDDLLLNGIVGILYFIEYVKSKVDCLYIMEEEDIHTTLLNLDCLSGIPNSLEIVKSLRRLQEKYCFSLNDGSIDCKILRNVLDIIIGMCELDTILTSGCEPSGTMESITHMIESCLYLEETPYDPAYTLPKNMFSMQVQKELNNFIPPKELVPTLDRPFTVLSEIFKQINDLLGFFSISDDPMELHQYVYYQFTTSKQLNAITRILYPHFLNELPKIVQFSSIEFVICDIETVCYLNKDSKEFMLDYMNNFLQYDVESLQETVTSYYYNFSSNHCRYRQGYNRQLLMWDSLQARFSMHEEQQEPPSSSSTPESSNKDEFPEVTSYIYYRKLKNMLEFQFRGFKLEIYDVWETFSIYWHCYDLLLNLDYLLQKLIDHNTDLINHYKKINQSKNLKKKYKSTEKRKTVKEKNEQILQKLNRIETNLSNEVGVCKTYSILCLVQLLQFVHCYRHLPANKLETYRGRMGDQLLYSLRFKTFGSFGIPQMPSLTSVLDSLEMFCTSQSESKNLQQSIRDQVEQCSRLVDEHIAHISAQESRNIYKFQLQWFEKIAQTCALFKNKYGNPITTSNDFQLVYPDGNDNDETHIFFPLYKQI